jgi:hypothetical protein
MELDVDLLELPVPQDAANRAINRLENNIRIWIPSFVSNPLPDLPPGGKENHLSPLGEIRKGVIYI